MKKQKELYIFPIFITNSINAGTFNKAVGPGKKNPKLINVGPMFIPESRVHKRSCFEELAATGVPESLL